MHLRRYYLGAEYTARLQGDLGGASALKGLRLAVPGTPLPDSFPFLSYLRQAGLVASEDIKGAEPDELRRVACLSLFQARAILAALESSS